MWVLLSFQASCLHQEGAELSPREPWAKDSRIPQALPPTPAPESAVLGVPAAPGTTAAPHWEAGWRGERSPVTPPTHCPPRGAAQTCIPGDLPG